jgi:LPXTG-motif cell wall-anchored protein
MAMTRVRRAASLPAILLMLAMLVGTLLSGPAAADTTCYTGCTSGTTGITTTTTTVAASSPSATATPTTAAVAGATSSSTLALTGAHLETMALVGVAAIGVGFVLVRKRRRTI